MPAGRAGSRGMQTWSCPTRRYSQPSSRSTRAPTGEHSTLHTPSCYYTTVRGYFASERPIRGVILLSSPSASTPRRLLTSRLQLWPPCPCSHGACRWTLQMRRFRTLRRRLTLSPSWPQQLLCSVPCARRSAARPICECFAHLGPLRKQPSPVLLLAPPLPTRATAHARALAQGR
ncbi:hypothetical protein T492DRAFT_1151618 [Pavlovales sp. CCMP2436]|nr:hypothetical protein T492DRAFT_1151618 [Pavlovales sp. CCMP2436]